MLDTKQVLIVFEGTAEIALNEADEEISIRVERQDLFSAPANVWRSIRSVGNVPLLIAVMSAGDQKKHIRWATEITAAAAQAGFGVDHNGYVAPLRLLPFETRQAAEVLVATAYARTTRGRP
jgi:hypothetical protein